MFYSHATGRLPINARVQTATQSVSSIKAPAEDGWPSAKTGPPQGAALWGEDPIATRRRWHYFKGMNILLLMVVLLLLFGGGGFYLGGPVIGGSGIGLILLICLVLFITGGFRPRKS